MALIESIKESLTLCLRVRFFCLQYLPQPCAFRSAVTRCHLFCKFHTVFCVFRRQLHIIRSRRYQSVCRQLLDSFQDFFRRLSPHVLDPHKVLQRHIQQLRRVANAFVCKTILRPYRQRKLLYRYILPQLLDNCILCFRSLRNGRPFYQSVFTLMTL